MQRPVLPKPLIATLTAMGIPSVARAGRMSGLLKAFSPNRLARASGVSRCLRCGVLRTAAARTFGENQRVPDLPSLRLRGRARDRAGPGGPARPNGGPDVRDGTGGGQLRLRSTTWPSSRGARSWASCLDRGLDGGRRRTRASSELMDADPPVVTPTTDQETVAWTMVRRRESSVAVVNGKGEFVGLVPPIECSVRCWRNTTRTSRGSAATSPAPSGRGRRPRSLSAAGSGTGCPGLSSGSPAPWRRAAIVGAFEEELKTNVLLAVFVPAVVYMADAVGTQTEALLIRGLSVGVVDSARPSSRARDGSRDRYRRRRHLLSVRPARLGRRVGRPGGVRGAAGELLDSHAGGDGCCPGSLQRLGADPAFGSGPLATVIQDLLSITVYFAVAIPIVGS